MNSLCQERMAAAMAAALAVKGSMASENSVEMRRYLNKLKDLVPHCPKNRKVTKLELIQHVIDYISDLQDTLQSDTESESPPESPVERMSFSDAYDMPPTHAFSGYPSQDGRHTMTSAEYSHGFGGSSHDTGHRYGGSLDYSSEYSSNTAYSSMAPAGAGYGVGCSSLGGAFSPILYSDQGTAPPPRFASS
uniref:BHLH domain-containing protein n=1 Tax=Scylla olivacea TaxID=85551 RepID=A0A0P4WJA1_SCYOL